MRIQHNIAALNSYRNLTGNNNAVAKNLEKLSSGYRINRAGDDAAGLAISEKMRAQITGLNTAQKNAQDGVSLLNAFDDGRNNVLEQVTTLGTKSQFLTATKDRLETDKLNLATQLDNVVNIDMADAITQYSWAQYAYNAALKVGTSILSPSFIDFMK